MWNSILQRVFSGIAWGGMVTFIALTVFMVNNTTPDITMLWTSMLLSFIIGIYFGLASFIFIIHHWSPLKKTAFHFIISIIVYFFIAIPVGWIPLQLLPILLSIGIFIVTYIIFWFGFNLYYKKVTASLNESLKKK